MPVLVELELDTPLFEVLRRFEVCDLIIGKAYLAGSSLLGVVCCNSLEMYPLHLMSKILAKLSLLPAGPY